MEKFEDNQMGSMELSGEEIFQQYVSDFNLKPEDFNKVILDVGAGSAAFAKWAKEHNVSSQIYSLEPVQEMLEKERGLVGVAEQIPLPNEAVDLIISTGAVPNIYLGEKDAQEKVKKSFSEMLRVARKNGEIRLARVLIGDKDEAQKALAKCIEQSLQELQEVDHIEVIQMHTPHNDAYEYDKNHNKTDLLAQSFLIVIKKKI